MRIAVQGTVKELRAQLAALGRAQARRGAYRAAASVGSVACLAGAYLWRVYDLGAAGPVRVALAILLLGCTAMLVRLSRVDLDLEKLSLVSQILAILRPIVRGCGPLSVRASLGRSTAEATGDWLNLTFLLRDAQIQMDAQGSTSALFTFRCNDPAKVAALKTAIDSSLLFGDSSNEVQDGALRTILRAVAESDKGTASLVRRVEGYVGVLKAVSVDPWPAASPDG